MGSIYADLGTAAHEVLEQCLRMTYEMGLPMKAVDYAGKEIEVEDGPHSKLSPSGAKRWTTCAAAPTLEAKFPEAMQRPRMVTFEDDYVAAVQTCLDYVEQQRDHYISRYGSCEVYAERRVSPYAYLRTDACDGTADITLVAGNGAHIEVIDFKGGSGVFVDVMDPQFELYLLGVLAELGDAGVTPESATLTVVQPREVNSGEPGIRSRTIDNLSDWALSRASYFRQKIIEAENPEAPATPSAEACRFCSAKGACEAYQTWALRQAGFLPDEISIEDADLIEAAALDTRALSDAALRKLLDAREVLVGALQAAEAWALELLLSGSAGEAVARGYKVVRGRSNRTWAQDEGETEKALKKIKVQDGEKKRGLGRKDIFETRLMSIAQIERLLANFGVPKKDARFDAVARLTTKPPGKLTIAPMSDPRPSETAIAKPEAAEAFDQIEADGPPPDFT